MQSLHTKLNAYGLKHPALQQRLWLTSAISPNNGPDWQLQNIDFSSTGATKYVDFFNVMAYDAAGTWNTMASSTAALRDDATIDSHRSNRIIPGWQSRMSFEAKAANLL